jgi:hypothetical protein
MPDAWQILIALGGLLWLFGLISDGVWDGFDGFRWVFSQRLITLFYRLEGIRISKWDGDLIWYRFSDGPIIGPRNVREGRPGGVQRKAVLMRRWRLVAVIILAGLIVSARSPVSGTARPPVQEIFPRGGFGPAELKRLQDSADARKRDVRIVLDQMGSRRLNSQREKVSRIRSFLQLSDEAEGKNDMRTADALAERAQVLVGEFESSR